MCEEGAQTKAGMTPIEATEFLHKAFPEVPDWTYFDLRCYDKAEYLAALMKRGFCDNGAVGGWRWERVASPYPRLAYWNGLKIRLGAAACWVGVLRVTSPEGVSFLMFSYLSHKDKFCRQYLFSTDDHALLGRFIKIVAGRFGPRKRRNARVVVVNGPDFEVPTRHKETLFLPDNMLADIETQVSAFFENKKLFQKLGGRYQRGFLFLGPPGTGKTMTIRRIIRTCHQKYRVRFYSMRMNCRTDEDDLKMLFVSAVDNAPSVVLLDDMDSLTRETMISRSAVLSTLDGMSSNQGVLIIGTSNNAADIDPALVHRPSRFDRVWSFPLPDTELREKYLRHSFPDLDSEEAIRMARKTANWSYAYLNELRTTAMILAARNGQDSLHEETISEALSLLSRQFNAGRKGFTDTGGDSLTGFNAA